MSRLLPRPPIESSFAPLACLLQAPWQVELASVGIEDLVEQVAYKVDLTLRFAIEPFEVLGMAGPTKARGLDLDGPMGALRADESLARDPQALGVQVWSQADCLAGIGTERQTARLTEDVAAGITGTAQRDALTIGRSLHRPERPVQKLSKRRCAKLTVLPQASQLDGCPGALRHSALG